MCADPGRAELGVRQLTGVSERLGPGAAASWLGAGGAGGGEVGCGAPGGGRGRREIPPWGPPLKCEREAPRC